MVGAVWLANVARNSALVTSFVGLTSATLASTKASIANAFSVQGQITAYNALSTRLMLLRLTKAHYIDLTKTAIVTTTAYARSLVGLAGSFDRTTLAAKVATLASIGWTKTKRGAMGVGILATRAITGLGGAFMALGMLYLPLLIICLLRWAIPQRAVRGHLLAFLTQAMVALWVCYKLPPKPLI